ncbi:hypothetical protein VZT92_017418 [Zoarces viviparus]|uniref:Reelin domain-containing protein n=1 Tax=Zoarces viviparus TaxID=48416 RepID=A0AAW1ER71_ZOAVI
MQSSLRCFGVGVVLFSLAPSTLTFSRGAGHASCRDMIPGHIRAQPRDPKRVHVALHTSASSYLPGQFVTVTVRSSRDFMGFLLQARSVEGPGVGARTGARSTSVAPELVGGSWTLTPPGTHTLRCLSEDDTLTHSDKQLKRNLSFVWRAPEGPMGDIRFYITVVQSYFVYWAGIESAVVHDGSRHPWTRSNISVVDGRNSALQGDEVTALPASNKQTKQTASHAITLGPVSRPVSEANHLTNQVGDERKNRAIILGSNQNATKGSENETYRTPGSVSGEAEEAGTDTGSSEDPKSSLQLTNHVPTTIAIPSTKHVFHDANLSRSASQNPRETIQDQTRSVKFVTQRSSSQTWRTSESHTSLIKDEKGRQSMPRPQNLRLKPSLHWQTSSTKPLLHSQTGPSHIFPFSQEPSSMSRTSLSFILPSKTPTLQSFVKTQTTPPLSQAYSLSIHVFPIKPMSSLPQPENSPSGPKTRSRKTSPHQPRLQTAAPLRSPPQPQPLSSFTQVLPQTIPTQTLSQTSYPQTDQSKSRTPAEALSISPLPWSQRHSQTSSPQALTFRWKQTQSSATPRSINPPPFTSRFTLGEDKEVKDPTSQAKLKTMSLIFASIPSTTPSLSTPFSSTHTMLASSLVPPSTPLYPSRGSALLSVWTSLSSSPSSSSMKNQIKTAPALFALSSPSPISIPPHLLLVHPSSTSHFPSSLTSSTKPPSNSSNYPSLAPLIASVPLSTSSSSPFTSSESITGSTVSSPSFPTISPALSSSSASSTSSISSPPSPHYSSSSISTSTPTSPSNLSATSSFLPSSQTTSPHPEPSPAPRRSLYNPLTSSTTSSPIPSKQLTLGQRMPIQNHIESSDTEPNLNLQTPRTVVHPNPERHPNLDPNFDLNLGHMLKPNLPKTDTKPKPPSNPPSTPDKEGKYPDINARYSAWELGMLLGCSAGLGMVLVVGVRYMCRQACGKQTEVTLNDRETEYGRGERGLLHVQECGDLVRVRRIRENSFVLLAEYDVLPSPGD